nr:hypothetical protein [Tanacetum cinerariifolium]
ELQHLRSLEEEYEEWRRELKYTGQLGLSLTDLFPVLKAVGVRVGFACCDKGLKNGGGGGIVVVKLDVISGIVVA